MAAKKKTTSKKATASIAAQIAELEVMGTGELRAKFLEVHGEETRSRNAAYLRKKIAWRIQANAQGGLSERAKKRAAELADEANIRVNAPRKKKGATTAPAPERTVVKRFTAGHDPRLPLPGTLLTRVYKGTEIRVTVLEQGFEWDGTVYRSLSGIAKAVTGSQWNGFLFFGLTGKKKRK